MSIEFAKLFLPIFKYDNFQRVRPGEPLLAERYITNPQYAACAGVMGSGTLIATGGSIANDSGDENVPLLDRTGLTFLEEIGEGCFGKVHKGI